MAEVVATVAIAAAPAIAEGVGKGGAAMYDWLKEKVAFAENLEEADKYLEEAMEMLGAKRDDFQYKVNRSKTKVTSKTYDDWFCRVMKIENEVKKSKTRNEKDKASFFCIFACADPKDKMKRMLEEVLKLLQQANQFQEFLVDQPPERVVKMRAPDINGIETRKEALHKLVKWLKNEKVKRIGIHGKLGIGKTAIMLNLNNHAGVAKMFDIVIWLKVSTEESNQNLSTKHLQQAIMGRLKLDNEVTNNAGKDANRILKELENQKYLLLLDDVNQQLDLSQLGIPDPDGKNGSKIVLTTRLRHVFLSMDVNQALEVTSLSKEEPWKMFKDVLQCPKLIKDSKKGSIAFRICKECGGHPLLIETIAKTFKVKNGECLWADGLNSWRLWSEKERQGIKKFYKLLEKFCYDELDDDQKKCFLYSALFREGSDIYIDNLLECWAAENLLKRENPYVNGHDVLFHLKDVSLLEVGESGEYVTMHKCFRQVALDISSSNPECKYLVKTSGALREPPNVESWKQKNWISMIDNQFEKLPNCPNCSMVSTLFLQENLGLKIIPASFFDHMKSLRVLDMSQTGIASLPPSLSKLINLKVLNLTECKYLVELASQIEKLGHLEALDIRGSGVNGIPPHIENLSYLRHLRVSFTKSGNENDTQEVGFGHEIISKLSRLEALVIDVKSLEQWPTKVVEEVIKEVVPLENFRSLKFSFSNEVVDVIEVVLTTLRIYVPEADILQTFINESRSWRNVQHINSFQFFIGCNNSKDPQIPNMDQYEKYIKYCDGESSNPSILEALVEADAFELVDHKDIKQLSDFAVASMNKVRGCLVKSCNTIETIVGIVDRVVLQNLVHLYVMDVPKLESIFKGTMEPGSLSNLETLVLSSCPLLIKIFPHGVLQQLIEIQYLKIEHCSEIEEIISEAEIVTNLQVLPKLKKLKLLNMPKLKSLWKGPMTPGSLSKLETLVLSSCPILIKIFPHGVIQQLIEIQYLKIEDCSGIEEIISEAEIVANLQVLPKLKKLTLVNMPNLKSIYANESLEWPTLEELEILKCPRLLKLPFYKDNAKELNSIKAEKDWWTALKWQNKEIKELLTEILHIC